MKRSKRVFAGVASLVFVAVLYWTYEARTQEERTQALSESQGFFSELCKTRAGEFIHRTVDEVEGLAQLRLRDYSKDYFDEARKGKYPEDPYGHVALGWGGERGSSFVRMQDGQYRAIYTFFETVVSPGGAGEKTYDGPRYHRYSKYDPKTGVPSVQEEVESLKSQYGYTFRGIESPEFTKYRIMGGETVILDVRTKETLAVFRGFMRLPPHYDVCPKGDATRIYPHSLEKFVTKVLKPAPSRTVQGGR